MILVMMAAVSSRSSAVATLRVPLFGPNACPKPRISAQAAHAVRQSIAAPMRLLFAPRSAAPANDNAPSPRRAAGIAWHLVSARFFAALGSVRLGFLLAGM